MSTDPSMPSRVSLVGSNGDTYEGEWAHGQPHGEGKHVNKADGSIREGTWSEGEFVSGKRTLPDEQTQRGTFRDDQLHGPACVIAWTTGDRYEGEARHGQLHGLGQFTRKESGRVYAGEWANDKLSGFGVLLDPAGAALLCGLWENDEVVEPRPVPLARLPADLFTKERERGAILVRKRGEWYRGAVDADHQAHGEGIWLDADGRVKEKGAFVDGLLTKGFAEWPYGDTFEGQWKDGLRHGEGKHVSYADDTVREGTWRGGTFVSGKRTFADGEIQRGTFLNGALHGPACIRVWSSGDRYEGAIRDGLKGGVGKYIWKASGKMYAGEWANNVRSGLGVQRGPDREVLHCGEWAEDRFIKSCPVPRSSLPAGSLSHADDALLFPDGRTYRGALNSDHHPHGSGSMHRLDGSEESRGDWVNGALTGLGLLHLSNGDVFEGQLKAGKRKGFGVLWNAEGKLLKCGEWSSGLFNALDSRPVSGAFIPFGDRLHPLALVAPQYLLYPSGELFIGPLIDGDQPHGEGTLYSAHGVAKRRGVWTNGRFVGATPFAPDATRPPFSDAAIAAAVDAAVKAAAPLVTPASPALHAAAAVVEVTPLSVSADPLQSAAIAANVPMDVDTPPAASGPKQAEAAVASEIPPASALLLPASDAAPRRRSALCIGNNNYAPPLQPLTCCWTDAERMGCALQRLKFDSSVVRTDLNYSSLNNEINAFIDSLKQQRYGPGDLALLYFSGHGCELGTNNVYLLPTDISCDDADQGGLSVQCLQRRFNRALAGVQIVMILECCRVLEPPAAEPLASEPTLSERCRQVEAEARRADREEALKRKIQRQFEAEERKGSQYSEYSESEQLSESLYSLSSSSLPAVRPQPSIAPHADDLTRNHFAVVYSCDTGHLAWTGLQGGSVFSTCLIGQMQAPSAELTVTSLVERSNKQMRRRRDAKDSERQSAWICASAEETITLAAQSVTPLSEL